MLAITLLLASALNAGAVTTTNPVTLCIGRNGSVTVSSSGGCTSRETPVRVASAEDAAALAAQLDADTRAIQALQDAQAAQEDAVDELVAEVFPGALTIDVIPGVLLVFQGVNLQGGSPVTAHGRLVIGGIFSEEVGTVAEDRTFYLEQRQVTCVGPAALTEVWVTGVGRSGEAVESPHVDPC